MCVVALNSPQDTFLKLTDVLSPADSEGNQMSFPTREKNGDGMFESTTVFLPIIQTGGYGPCYYRRAQGETGAERTSGVTSHSPRIAGRKVQGKPRVLEGEDAVSNGFFNGSCTDMLDSSVFDMLKVVVRLSRVNVRWDNLIYKPHQLVVLNELK